MKLIDCKDGMLVEYTQNNIRRSIVICKLVEINDNYTCGLVIFPNGKLYEADMGRIKIIDERFLPTEVDVIVNELSVDG
jgi:hypothetical protein